MAGSGDCGFGGQRPCFRRLSRPPIPDIVLSVGVEDVVVSASVVAASNGKSSDEGDKEDKPVNLLLKVENKKRSDGVTTNLV